MAKEVKRKELGVILCDSDTGEIVKKTDDLDMKLVAHRNTNIDVIVINSFNQKFDRITFFSVQE